MMPVADNLTDSVHISAVLSKEVVKSFYGTPHTKAYYMGCSTGGRQGLKAAQSFPKDFDGIVAGAPAADFNNLLNWSGNIFKITGPKGSPTFLTEAEWKLVHDEVLKQCDLPLDGVQDGILEDSLLCNPRPEALICAPGETTGCLTPAQAETVRLIYSPLYGEAGTLLYTRMNPGSEVDAAPNMYNGVPFVFAEVKP